MFLKIVSQFFFTCSTFFFLSASLFSIERGEGPAEEKKAPVLSTEQKTAMSRRAEESIEDEETDPSQGLARSMGGCQLSDPTIINSSQKEDQQRSSLQEDENSDTGSGMEGIQRRVNEFAGNDPMGKLSASPEKSKSSTAPQFAEVTPSPGKGLILAFCMLKVDSMREILI